MQSVTIYSTPTCHFCHMAKDFFAENKIPFTDYNVASDLEKRKEMVQKSGQLGVPVITVRSKLEWEKAQAEATRLVGKLTARDKILVLCALYWGEGTKRELNIING